MIDDAVGKMRHDAQAFSNGPTILLGCLAFPHELLVRRFGSMGERYATRTAAGLGILLVPWLALFLGPAPQCHTGWVAVHAALLFVCAIINTGCRCRRRERVHSWYSGRPRWGGAHGRAGETILGLVIAALWFPFSPGVAIDPSERTAFFKAHWDALTLADTVQTMESEGYSVADIARLETAAAAMIALHPGKTIYCADFKSERLVGSVADDFHAPDETTKRGQMNS